MNNKFSLAKFFERFPDNNACLEEIKNIRWPNGIFCKECGKITKFYKIKGINIKPRPAYQCEFSGAHQVSPLAGTIFEKTTTPLQYWFYAIFLMIHTRSGISAKQLQRELGVTYKTAWRMFKQIRMLMADMDSTLLEGTVEIDETFVGGKAKNRTKLWNPDTDQKEVVMGMLQRGGKAYLKHVANTGKWTLLAQIKEHVNPKARILTDEYRSYTHLPRYGYKHDYVNHQYEYARGDVHTQNIENVWSHFKRGIYGVYRIVSKKYLQAYADEYAFRYNNRKAGDKMFDLLLQRITEIRLLKSPKPSLATY